MLVLDDSHRTGLPWHRLCYEFLQNRGHDLISLTLKEDLMPDKKEVTIKLTDEQRKRSRTPRAGIGE